MIMTDLEYLEKELFVAAAGRAAAYLAEAVRNPPADGRADLDGDRMYAVVQSYSTRAGKENPRFEAHRRYIDIQFVLAGFELCGWAPLARLSTQTPYDEARDILFGRVDQADSMLLPLPVGRAVVFHPWDAHAPCLAAAGPEPVRKVVVKIAV